MLTTKSSSFAQSDARDAKEKVEKEEKETAPPRNFLSRHARRTKRKRNDSSCMNNGKLELFSSQIVSFQKSFQLTKRQFLKMMT